MSRLSVPPTVMVTLQDRIDLARDMRTLFEVAEQPKHNADFKTVSTTQSHKEGVRIGVVGASATSREKPMWAIVPIKTFDRAKQRLANVLSEEERRSLMLPWPATC